METLRTARGGPDRLDALAREPFTVAGIGRGVFWLEGTIAALGDAWQEVVTLGGPPEVLPKDAAFEVLGKDVSEAIAKDEPKIAAMVARGMAVYDEVLRMSPDVVAVWTDEYAQGRAACLAARELGIPSVEIRHGAVHPYRHGHWGAVKYATHTCGSWEYRDWHRFYGLPGEAIATGAVSVDPYAKVRVGDLQLTARSELQIPLEVPVVCYLTDAVFARNAWQDYGLAYGKTIEFLKAFKQLTTIVRDVHLVISVHPSERSEDGKKVTAKTYEAILADAHITENFSIVDQPLVLALSASDLVVGPQSSAMASALLMGIPCVVLGYEPFFPEHVYSQTGCTVVRDHRDVLRVLTELLIGEEHLMERLLGETQRGGLYFGSDGSAWWRVARVIERLARGEGVDEQCWGPIPRT